MAYEALYDPATGHLTASLIPFQSQKPSCVSGTHQVYPLPQSLCVLTDTLNSTYLQGLFPFLQTSDPQLSYQKPIWSLSKTAITPLQTVCICLLSSSFSQM